MKRMVLAVLALSMMSFAAETAPRLENLVLSDAKGGKAMKSFKPAAAKIFLVAKIADLNEASVVKAVWVAEKTDAAPPNYSIDATELKAGRSAREVTFTMSKPSAGWPTGAYRVDLFIDGKPAGQVPFSVGK